MPVIGTRPPDDGDMMRFDHEADTATLTLTLDNGDKVYLPTNPRDFYLRVKPYMPTRQTPMRLLVSAVQCVVVSVVGSVILAIGSYAVLSAVVYLGWVAGVILAVVFIAFLWRLCDYILERMLISDDITISRFKRQFTD